MEQVFEFLGVYGIFFLGLILIALGFVGSILPVIPGPPIAFIAILLVHFGLPGAAYSLPILIVLIVLTILMGLADYFVPILGTKKFGGTKYGVKGSTIGLVVGVLITFLTSGFGIALLLLGPFIGAFLGEKYAKNDNSVALKSAVGSLVGFLAGTFGKVIVVFVLLLAFLWKALPVIF